VRGRGRGSHTCVCVCVCVRWTGSLGIGREPRPVRLPLLLAGARNRYNNRRSRITRTSGSSDNRATLLCALGGCADKRRSIAPFCQSPRAFPFISQCAPSNGLSLFTQVLALFCRNYVIKRDYQQSFHILGKIEKSWDFWPVTDFLTPNLLTVIHCACIHVDYI
jgi:hypothetical protein